MDDQVIILTDIGGSPPGGPISPSDPAGISGPPIPINPP
jgi:hypothetical protein